jgi:hypothetical protein
MILEVFFAKQWAKICAFLLKILLVFWQKYNHSIDYGYIIGNR